MPNEILDAIKSYYRGLQHLQDTARHFWGNGPLTKEPLLKKAHIPVDPTKRKPWIEQLKQTLDTISPMDPEMKAVTRTLRSYLDEPQFDNPQWRKGLRGWLEKIANLR